MFENISYYAEDLIKPCNAGRGFYYKHDTKVETAVLCIHGYAGYPGELIRPAYDLFLNGCDVFVPRLKGHGTNSSDFIKTNYKDWIKTASTLYENLLNDYKYVHIIGHSMGCDIAVLIAKSNSKLVLAAPALKHNALNFKSVLSLTFLSLFKKRINTSWHSNPKYRMHYYNAPADDEYLGSQYWSYLYPKQLLSLVKIMKLAQKKIKQLSDFLLIIPKKDKDIGVPSLSYVKEQVKNPYKVREIENGTHFVFYDIDSKAEDEAVKEVVSFLGK